MANLVKGWFYVAVTSALLFILVSRVVGRIVESKNKIEEQQKIIQQQLTQLEDENEKIENQNKLLNTILENTAAGIIVMNANGNIISMNPYALQIYGVHSTDEYNNEKDFQLKFEMTRLDGSPIEYADRAIVRALRGETFSDYVMCVSRKDIDLKFTGIYNAMPILDDHGHMIMTVVTLVDITNRVNAENRVRELSEELQIIIDSTDDFIWSVDKSFKVISYNSAIVEYVKDSYGGEVKKGISMRDVMLLETALAWDDLYDRALIEGKFNTDLKTQKGDRIMAFSINPVYDKTELIEITVLGKDITERVNREREIVQLNKELENIVQERTLELQETVQELQSFSVAISHDLKTHLREIQYYAKHIIEHTNIDADATKVVAVCSDTAEMIDKLLNYSMSSRRELQKEKLDLRKVIVSVHTHLKATYNLENAILEFQTGLPKVNADKTLMVQAMTNIISNALKFSAGRKDPTITVGCKTQNNEYVFYIEDNGVGFEMQYAGKLFGLFERMHSRSEYEGSGIGLATVKKIIQRHGGKIWIESEVNEGTTVYFTLPVIHE